MKNAGAQGVDRYGMGAITEPVQNYFLNTEALLPNNIKVYFWPYPYQGHVMAPDCGYMDTRIGSSVAIWFLKFFPIGFMVTFNEPDNYNFNLWCLSRWGGENVDFEVEIPINLNEIQPQYWPEAPLNHSVILYGQEAIVSYGIKQLKTNRGRND